MLRNPLALRAPPSKRGVGVPPTWFIAPLMGIDVALKTRQDRGSGSEARQVMRLLPTLAYLALGVELDGRRAHRRRAPHLRLSDAFSGLAARRSPGGSLTGELEPAPRAVLQVSVGNVGGLST